MGPKPFVGSASQVLETSPGVLVRRSVLPGGVRVLTEHMEGHRTATVGFWMAVGSRDETQDRLGSTHFLEHLLFKGTATRSSEQIAAVLDELGGESNALTAKESTCYYMRVLDTDLRVAVQLLAEMVSAASLNSDNFDAERQVILEELAMDNDDASNVAHEKFVAAALGDHPLARPIGGTPETIQAMTVEAMREHYRTYYQPSRLVVAVAGAAEHGQMCQWVLESLHEAGWQLPAGEVPAPARTQSHSQLAPRVGEQRIARPVEQAHVLVGGPALVATDDRRYALSLLNTVLGGGVSSRLFQEVREKRGLAYATYSFAGGYTDAGYFGMYAGCAIEKVEEVIAILRTELERLAQDGVGKAEWQRSLRHIAGATVLGLESTSTRMNRLGSSELVYGEYVDTDVTLERLRAVTPEELQGLAQSLMARATVVTVVGPEKVQ